MTILRTFMYSALCSLAIVPWMYGACRIVNGLEEIIDERIEERNKRLAEKEMKRSVNWLNAD